MKKHRTGCHFGTWPGECGGNGHEYCKSIIRQCRRESSGHKQSVNKHRKSARGRRKGKGGGENVRGYVWAGETEKNKLHLISFKASSTPFSSGRVICLILLTKSSEGCKYLHAPRCHHHNQPFIFIFLYKQISFPLCNSAALLSHFIHPCYGSPYKQSIF